MHGNVSSDVILVTTKFEADGLGFTFWLAEFGQAQWMTAKEENVLVQLPGKSNCSVSTK